MKRHLALALLLLTAFSVGCKPVEAPAPEEAPKKKVLKQVEAPVPEEASKTKVLKQAEAPAPEYLPTPPDLSKTVEEELNKLSLGQILFNPPQEMKTGVKEKVEVRISKKITEDLSAGLRGRGAPHIERIKVGTFMKVHLQGNNFDIKASSNEEQIVAGEGFTEWDFDVTPLKSGTQSLLLTVTVRIKIPNDGEEKKDLPVLERQIKVKANPNYSIKVFIGTYWQWIISAIIIPIVVWIAKRKRGSRNDKTP